MQTEEGVVMSRWGIHMMKMAMDGIIDQYKYCLQWDAVVSIAASQLQGTWFSHDAQVTLCAASLLFSQ